MASTALNAADFDVWPAGQQSTLGFLKAFILDPTPDPEELAKLRARVLRSMAVVFSVLLVAFLPHIVHDGMYKELPVVTVLLATTTAAVFGNLEKYYWVFGVAFCGQLVLFNLGYTVLNGPEHAFDIFSNSISDLMPLMAAFAISRPAALLFGLVVSVEPLALLAWGVANDALEAPPRLFDSAFEYAVFRTGSQAGRAVLMTLTAMYFHYWVKSLFLRIIDTAATRQRIISNLNHEIRTPVHGILGLTDALIRSGRFAEADFDLLRSIRLSGHALSHLLRNILDLSKLDAGVVTLEPKCFHLPTTCKHVVELFNASVAIKRQRLDLQLHPELAALVVGDEFRLYQVLCNILGNAIKFTPVGGTVTLAVAPADPAGHLRFTVTDTGEGVPEHQRARLFEPFLRGDISSTRRHGGAGLGLALCKDLVRLMNGRIWYEDAPTRGAVFIFEIPLPAATPADGPPSRPHSSPEEFGQIETPPGLRPASRLSAVAEFGAGPAVDTVATASTAAAAAAADADATASVVVSQAPAPAAAKTAPAAVAAAVDAVDAAMPPRRLGRSTSMLGTDEELVPVDDDDAGDDVDTSASGLGQGLLADLDPRRTPHGLRTFDGPPIDPSAFTGVVASPPERRRALGADDDDAPAPAPAPAPLPRGGSSSMTDLATVADAGSASDARFSGLVVVESGGSGLRQRQFFRATAADDATGAGGSSSTSSSGTIGGGSSGGSGSRRSSLAGLGRRYRDAEDGAPRAALAGRILLVEDNLVNQQVVSRQLQHLNFAVEVAPDGAAALEALQRADQAVPFDLVLMDLNMPVMDGFEATRAIRELERQRRLPAARRPHLPIIALTAEDEQQRQRALDAGMDDFFTKPANVLMLREALLRGL